MVGEHVVHQEAQRARRPEPFVDEAHGVLTCWGCTRLTDGSPHHDGPTGPDMGPAARRSPGPVDLRAGSCGSGRPAGPNSTLPPSSTSKVE